MTLLLKPKVYWETTSSSGLQTMLALLHIMVDTWVVISRGVDRYVTELAVEYKQSTYLDAVRLSAERMLQHRAIGSGRGSSKAPPERPGSQ